MVGSLVAGAAPVGSAFTYQGQLTERGSPADGTYDLQLSLFDAPSGGNPWHLVLTNADVTVSNGLFTTAVDFGPDPFDGTARWLEIGVRTSGRDGEFNVLSPRQPLTPTPYALYTAQAGNAISAAIANGVAANAVTTTGIANSNITSAKIASGQVVKSLNQLKDDVLLGAGTNITMAINGNMIVVSSPTWALGGNAGTGPASFLGTTDSQPLELKVNGQRALRLEPNGSGTVNSTLDFDPPAGPPFTVGSSNLVGGLNADYLDGWHSSHYWQRGGNSGSSAGDFLGTTDGQPLEFRVGGQRALWLGRSASDASVIVIGGAANNSVDPYLLDGATIAGGFTNVIAQGANAATIGGGIENTIGPSSWSSTIGGGGKNRIRGRGAVIAGGYGNLIEHDGGFIGGGGNNEIAGSGFADGDGVIAGGLANSIRTSSSQSTIGGGRENTILDDADYATIAGGGENTIQTNAAYATIAGGCGNQAMAPGAFVGGGGFDGMNFFHNVAAGAGSMVAGGIDNEASGPLSTIGGGGFNTASKWCATVPGGQRNVAGGKWSLAAGRQAKAFHDGAFVWADSTDTDFASTGDNQFLIRASGGVGINTTTPFATLDVAGGDALVRGPGNFIPGTDARLNLGDGNNYVRAVWGEGLRLGVWDGVDALAVNNGGTVGIGTTSPGARLHVASAGGQAQLFLEQTAVEDWARLRLGGGVGNAWDISVRNANEPSINFWNGSANAVVMSYFGTVTATAFNPTSDRNAKEHFAPVNPTDVLEKVVSLPITRWNFKQEAGVQHVGPVAQDFHAAFGLGTDNKHIATVDADGVALAAIQGLNQKMEQQRDENAALKRELESLKQLVGQLTRERNGGAQ